MAALDVVLSPARFRGSVSGIEETSTLVDPMLLKVK
jgi:hypothetical protein